MPYAEECERPFYVEPSILLKPHFAPSVACSSNAINSFVRGSMLIFVICALTALVYGGSIFLFGIVLSTALYGPSMYATLIGGAPEGFQADLMKTETNEDIIGSTPISDPVPSIDTKPAPHNPFMNILIDEIKYNPTKPPAQDINDPKVKTQLDDFFRIQWFSDPTDVFGRSQSQRQFYTMPSTSIPNDQASYQDWLYKIPGKTCKEGGREACAVGGTSGAVIPWLNADR